MAVKRDNKGRVLPGSKLAEGHRRAPQRKPDWVFDCYDEAMRSHGEERQLADFVIEAIMRNVEAMSRGDLEAGRWLAEQFGQLDRERVLLSKRLPSPTKRPLQYLDALVRAVGRGELTTQQATRLGNLVKPLVADAQLLEMRRELDALRKRVAEQRGFGSAEVIPFS